MKNYIHIATISLVLLLFGLSSCSTSRNVTYRDDVYNQNNEARRVYQSSDYYYTDEEYAGTENDYYQDEYSDQQYEEGYYQDEYSDLEYANRINRFYYNSPGMSYYDPWFDPWFGYAGFGLGFGSPWWGPSWSFGFGWGSPWYGHYSP